jgi:ketosteroid isomerase-like protein
MQSEEKARLMKDTVVEWLSAISASDGKRFRSLVTDDLRNEMPFASEPFPKESEGGDSIAEKITGAKRLFSAFSLKATELYTVPDMDTVIIEAESDGKLVSGKSYSNQYVFIFKFREGKICFWREYFNPDRLPDLR